MPPVVSRSPVYLDHAATSPMLAPTLDAYTRALAEVGNPASTHGHGQRASEALEAARERIASVLGCDAAELMLTSGGTESINLALKGGFWARQRPHPRPVLLIAAGEHHATIEAAEWLRDHEGAEIVWLPITGEGFLPPETLRCAIEQHRAERIALVSILWANNEVGTVQDAAALTEIAREYGVPIHLDAVAALGQVTVSEVRPDLLSVSAHKIGGPVGVGALVLDRRAHLEPLLHGGSQQRARSGTQDVAGAVAFAAALEGTVDAAGRPHSERLARMAALRDRLIAGVRRIDPTAVLRGPDPSLSDARLAGSVHFTFPGCQGDSLVFLLDAAGFSVSVGSACRAGVAELSHVLLAMGVPEAEAAGALRLTLSPETTEPEVDAFLEALPGALERARAAGLVSP